MSEASIEWNRVAEPTDDEYDTFVALALGGSRLARPRSDLESPSFLEGAVRIRHVTPSCPYDPPMINAPLEHENIILAGDLLKVWPAARKQMQRLVHTFHPLWDESVPVDSLDPPLSSCSGAREDMLGVIFATVENPITLAEALVHEMAHIKLFALGISIEHPGTLITNPPEELYESSVIRNRLRPMSAVFHAAYTFTYIVELNLRLITSGKKELLEPTLSLLAANLVSVERGVSIIVKSARTDPSGAMFLEGYLQWAQRVIERGADVLNKNNIERVPLRELTIE